MLVSYLIICTFVFNFVFDFYNLYLTSDSIDVFLGFFGDTIPTGGGVTADLGETGCSTDNSDCCVGVTDELILA